METLQIIKDQGKRDYELGYKIDENPYKDSGRNGLYWIAGWVYARNKHEKKLTEC